MSDTRERILDAARAIMAESPVTGPSVRAVAERAGIGASTLRYYFPTQRALYDALVLPAFEVMFPDMRIREASVPPRERLLECVTQLLPRFQPGVPAVEGWKRTIDAVSGVGTSPQAQASLSALARRTRERVAEWLVVLAGEGVLREGSPERHARFLLAVVDGVGIGRILPEDHISPEEERQVLADAVDAVLV